MAQTSKNIVHSEIPTIHQIFKQEEEWKKLLAEEVNSLERAIFEREEKISEQKVLSKRDSEVSDLRVTLDQMKEEMVKLQQDAVDWRARFEEATRQASKRESELRRAANTALTKLAESEAAERRRLTAELTRAKADLESEKTRAATDLEEALAAAGRRASEATAEAEHAKMSAELRANKAEDVAARAKQNVRRLEQELLVANEAVVRVESELAAKTQALQQNEEKVANLNEALSEMEKLKAGSDLKLSRMESRREMEKNAMGNEIELLKESEKALKVQVYNLSRNLATIREEGEEENRRLLKAIAAAEKVAKENADALEATEIERQLAVKNARALETENRRLRGDLSRALAHGNAAFEQKKKGPKAYPQDESNTRDLIAQVLSLQLSCGKLEDENRQLRHQNSKNYDILELKRQLDYANQRIECLASENAKLIQLSNKMKARQMREMESNQATMIRRRVGTPINGIKDYNSRAMSPKIFSHGKMSPRGGDEISSEISSSSFDGNLRSGSSKPMAVSNAEINNNRNNPSIRDFK